MSEVVIEWRKKKTGYFFDFMDRNKDGYLTVDDFSHNIKYLETTGRKNEQIATALKRDMMSWWGLYQEYAVEGRGISRADFVKQVSEYIAHQANKPEIAKHYTLMFDVMDLDGDGNISVEELMLFYKAHGWTDENHVRDVFRKLDQNGDGFITRDELVHAGVQYWTSEDPCTGFLFDIRHL